jgi:RHS repeat-associated protein
MNDRFLGYHRSQVTGLDYAVNRFYDSSAAHFLELDPLGVGSVSLTDPQSINARAYVRNDPLNRSDALGLFDDDVLRCHEDGSIAYPGKPNCTLVGEEVVVVGNSPDEFANTLAASNTGIDNSRSSSFQNKIPGPGDPSASADGSGTGAELIKGAIATAAILATVAKATRSELEGLAKLFAVINSLSGEPIQNIPKPPSLPSTRPVAPISGSPPPLPPEVEEIMSKFSIIGETFISRFSSLLYVNPCLADPGLSVCGSNSGRSLY